jgi:hypothetical protein
MNVLRNLQPLSSTLHVEAEGYSETSVAFYQSTQHHILEDSNASSHWQENFRSHRNHILDCEIGWEHCSSLISCNNPVLTGGIIVTDISQK